MIQWNEAVFSSKFYGKLNLTLRFLYFLKRTANEWHTVKKQYAESTTLSEFWTVITAICDVSITRCLSLSHDCYTSYKNHPPYNIETKSYLYLHKTSSKVLRKVKNNDKERSQRSRKELCHAAGQLHW